MKLIGNGFIGKNLKKITFKLSKNYLIYCAGVSNSKSTDKKLYKKEIAKLNKIISQTNNRIIFAYISTTSVNDKNHNKNMYVKNKMKIESIIKKKIKNYIIIRLPQIIGKANNPNIISNYIFERIKKGQSFNAWANVERNFLDIDDIKKIIKYILNKKFNKSFSINIYNSKSINIIRFINIFSNILEKGAIYKKIHISRKIKGKNKIYKKDKNFIFATKKNYMRNILKKYYT